MTHYDELTAAADFVRDRTGRTHNVAITLGSGLSDFAASLPDPIEIPYGDIPGFPVPGVAGHGGSAFSAAVGDGHVLVFSGRVHFYEGWPLDRLVFGVRMAILSGCRTVVLTNASGGASAHLAAGDLALITDHINLTGRSPLIGENDDRLGPRFPDMSEVYSVRLRVQALEAAAEAGVELKEGVYAWFTGPAYETPAEVQMAKRLGGDLVGMSTVPEAVAARHMGAEVLGISLVTNLAAGISPTPLSHDEVKDAGAAARPRFAALLNGILPRIM